MKRIGMAVMLLLASSAIGAQQKPKDDPPPVLTDKAHADIRDTELALVQAQSQMQQLQQQFSAIQKQAVDLQTKLQAELKENEKAGYTLNPQTLLYVKSPPAEAKNPNNPNNPTENPKNPR